MPTTTTPSSGPPSRTIAYGAPDLSGIGSDRLAEVDLAAGMYHLVVARFEPENHVLEIVRGYVGSAAKLPLVVVGSAPYAAAYSAAVEGAADARVRLLGGVWDQDLLDQLYANALTYLHGHSVGGTNPSLLRAAGAGAPVVAFDCVFNREVVGADGWFFDRPAGLGATIEAAEADPGPFLDAGARLQQAVLRYDWDDVAARYEQLCADLIARRFPPKRPSGLRSGRAWTGQPARGDRVLMAHPSPDLYGSDRVLLESVSEFTVRGSQVRVALPNDGPLTAEIERRGGEVVFTPMPVLRKTALRPGGFVRLAAESLRSLGRNAAGIRAAGADVVYVNTVTIPTWLLSARLAGRPVLCHVHEAEASQHPLLRRALYLPLLLADRLVVNSRFSLDVLAASWPQLRRRAEVVYNGVPGPSAAPDLPRERLEGPLRLLFIGRLSPRKGPDVAIAALERLLAGGTEAHLTLLGAVFPGYEWFEDQLRDKVREAGLGDHVTFLGFDPDIWRHCAEADIIVVPSVVDEPFGNTAVEAILAKRAVVVSRTSGLKEAAYGFASARYVEPGDPDDLARAVRRIANDWPGVRAGLEADHADAVARFGPEVYGANLATVVEHLIERI